MFHPINFKERRKSMSDIYDKIERQMPRVNKNQLINYANDLTKSIIKAGFANNFNNSIDAADFIVKFYNTLTEDMGRMIDSPVSKNAIEVTQLALEKGVFNIPDEHINDHIYLATRITSFILYINKNLPM